MKVVGNIRWIAYNLPWRWWEISGELRPARKSLLKFQFSGIFLRFLVVATCHVNVSAKQSEIMLERNGKNHRMKLLWTIWRADLFGEWKRRMKKLLQPAKRCYLDGNGVRWVFALIALLINYLWHPRWSIMCNHWNLLPHNRLLLNLNRAMSSLPDQLQLFTSMNSKKKLRTTLTVFLLLRTLLQNIFKLSI